MEALGCERVVRSEDVAVMGITEVIRHLPQIYREYRKLKASIRERRIKISVLIPRLRREIHVGKGPAGKYVPWANLPGARPLLCY